MRFVGIAGLSILVGLLLKSDERPGSEGDWLALEGTAALLSAPCPPLSALQPSGPRVWWRERVSAAELAHARAGRFRVFGPRRTRLAAPVDWHHDPLQAKVYRNQLHKLRYLGPLLRTYAEAGDRRALRQAKELAFDWVRQNRRGKPETAQQAWSDKNVGDRVQFLAYTIRAAACEGMIDRSEARQALASIREHGRFLADPANHVPTNHGLFVDLGLVRLARTFPFLAGSSGWEERARKRFHRTLKARLANGIWLEHSSSYHFLVITAIEDLLRVIGSDEKLERALGRMRGQAGWFSRPDGVITQFGDSSQRPTPEWARASAGFQEGAKAFYDAGLYFVRSMGAEGEDAYLAVASGFHNATHKHADELSFELHDQGHPIVTDTGMYSKDPGHERDFTLSAAAHNTLTVDGGGFSLSERDSYGSGLLASGEGAGWHAVEGRNPLLRPHGVRHRRLFLYRPGEALIVVDSVRSSELHEYTRYLHLAPGIEIDDSEANTIALSAPGLAAWVTDGPAGPASQRTVARGQDEPMRGLTFPRFRVRVPRHSIDFTATGSTDVMAFSIALRTGPLPVTDARRSGRDWRVTVAPTRGRASTLTIRREGRMLAVSE